MWAGHRWESATIYARMAGHAFAACPELCSSAVLDEPDVESCIDGKRKLCEPFVSKKRLEASWRRIVRGLCRGVFGGRGERNRAGIIGLARNE